MNLDRIRQELAIDEGVRYEIYLDPLGYPTFGIGHLIKPADPEFKKPIGTPVHPDRVNQVFEEDIMRTVMYAESLVPNFYQLPEDAQHIIVNMIFNLGPSRFSRFTKFRAAIENYDFDTAAKEMKDSLWYRQVTNRAKRLITRMKLLIGAKIEY